MKQGDWSEAKSLLTAIAADPKLDTDYERLLLARVHEALAACAEEQKDEAGRAEHLYQFTTLFPQLVPFSGQRVPMRLSVSGTPDEKVVERLKACNINWEPKGAAMSPQAHVTFTGQAGEGRGRIEYWVEDARGAILIPRQRCTYELAKPEAAGVSMAYRLFGIGGKNSDGDEAEETPDEIETPEERDNV
jgi:hypothetical protein